MKRTSLAAIGALGAAVLLTATAVPVEASTGTTIVKSTTAAGTLLSSTLISQLTTAQVSDLLDDVPFEHPRIRYGVSLYRIEYATLDVRRRSTSASALVALPAHRGGRARTVVWEHGTRVSRTDVASVSGDNVDRPAAVLLATDGLVTIAPDYLGLGTGPGFHPYAHASSEASASVDALTAGRTLAGAAGQQLSDDVLISGFSQGGQAAMALAQALQGSGQGRRTGLRLRAVAPISGPYDLGGAEIPALFDGRVTPFIKAFYLAYWTVSSNRIYGLYRSPSEVFRPPYDQTLPGLFDGEHDEQTIAAALPASPEQLVTAQYAARLRHPRGALRQAIEQNSTTCQWRPAVPIRLYTASGDHEVPIANTEHCASQLRARGTDPDLVDLGRIDHLDEPVAALPGIVDWFDQVT